MAELAEPQNHPDLVRIFPGKNNVLIKADNTSTIIAVYHLNTPINFRNYI